jgi:hypothetical protein
VKAGQENCYACGQKTGTRAYRAERRVNPVVIIAACLAATLVFGGLWLGRANAVRKQAAQLAEEEVLRGQDSTRRANRDWLDAERVAKEDNEVRALAVELDAMEGRLKSVRLRVAANPSPRQESIIRMAEGQLALLREAAIVLGVSPEGERQTKRDSIQAGERRVEDLTKELGSTE